MSTVLLIIVHKPGTAEVYALIIAGALDLSNTMIDQFEGNYSVRILKTFGNNFAVVLGFRQLASYISCFDLRAAFLTQLDRGFKNFALQVLPSFSILKIASELWNMLTFS